MLDFWLWVYSLDGVGSTGVVNLIDRYGENPDVSRVIAYVRKSVGWNKQQRLWRAEADVISSSLRSRLVEVLPYWDRRYPERLRQIPDFPAFLFYRGDSDLLSRDVMLSVVGTRKMSEYGRQCVHEVIGGLVPYEMGIVSGMAYGVDSEAHRVLMNGSVPRARPVAVLPGGPCGGYPHVNKDVYDFTLDSGCVIWEFLPGTPVKPQLFAVRNRIIAGLSKCTLVIDSPERGGSMITAHLALQYDRDVAACPGSIFNNNAAGPNMLISAGAYLIRSANDVLKCLCPGNENVGSSLAEKPAEIIARALSDSFKIDKEQAVHLSSEIRNGCCTLDMLSDRLNMDVPKARACLTRLEVAGILRLKPDGRIKIDK